MDLRQLRYFVELAEAGGFNEAGLRLRISQSSISRRVGDLEAELGVALVERHPRGVVLTEAGRILLARAVDLIHDVEHAKAEVAGRSSLPSGVVAVGTSPAMSAMILGPLAQTFQKDFPRLRLQFSEGAQYVLLEGLETGRIDLAVMVSPQPIRSCKLEPLVVEPLHLVTMRARRARQRVLALDDLDGIPLVLFPRPSAHRSNFDRAADAAGIRMDVRFEISDIEVQKDLIRRGLVCGILPLSAVHEEVARRRLYAYPINGLSLTQTLVSRANREALPAVAAVARAIREIMLEFVRLKSFGGGMRPVGEADSA